MRLYEGQGACFDVLCYLLLYARKHRFRNISWLEMNEASPMQGSLSVRGSGAARRL